MAGIRFNATPTVTTVATGTGPRTLLQLIAASNHRTIVKQIDVSFNGVTAGDGPILIDVMVQTNAGTQSALTLSKINSLDTETLQTTATQGFSSTDPTSTTTIWQGYWHEMTGGVIPVFDIPIPGGTRLGVRYTSGTITGTVKAAVNALCEE